MYVVSTFQGNELYIDREIRRNLKAKNAVKSAVSLTVTLLTP